MFPRVALIIVGVLVVLIGTVVVIGQMEAREAHHVSACERGIARPYLQLMTYMRELAEAGRFDELRKVIIARGSAMEISKIAINQGMRTLRLVALDKVREGVTTLEQTLVVTASH